MCNAWNHPSNCSCGWGGTGHQKLPTNDSQMQWDFGHSINVLHDSYVIPNARCPVCGEGVFFYSNASGSRVFFDELGPPWPKHPCTDDKSTPQPSDPSKQIQRKFSWQNNGLLPFFIDSIASYDNTSIRISGHTADRSIFFYIEKKPFEYSIEHLGSGNIVALVNNRNNPTQLHFLSETGKPVKTATYQFSTEIYKVKNQSTTLDVKLKNPLRSKSSKKPLNALKKETKPNTQKETTMSLALKKAMSGEEHP